MSFEPMDFFGLADILGVRRSSGLFCDYTRTNPLTGDTIDVRIEGEIEGGNIVNLTENSFAGRSFVNELDANHNDGTLGTLCGNISFNGFDYSGVGGFNTEASGVWEYVLLMAAVAGVAVLLTVIMKGIDLTKIAVKATTEDTDENSPIEWYTGADGKEYYRVKHKVKMRDF